MGFIAHLCTFTAVVGLSWAPPLFQAILKHELDHCRSTPKRIWTVNYFECWKCLKANQPTCQLRTIFKRPPRLWFRHSGNEWPFWASSQMKAVSLGSKLTFTRNDGLKIKMVILSDLFEWRPLCPEGGCLEEASWVSRPRYAFNSFLKPYHVLKNCN